MPKKTPDNAVLLEKLLAFQLYALGASQDQIAKAVGRSKTWVNNLVRGLPKGGLPDGGQKGKKRSRNR